MNRWRLEISGLLARWRHHRVVARRLRAYVAADR